MANKEFKVGFEEGNPGLKRYRAEQAAKAEAERKRKEDETIRKERFYQKHDYADVSNPPQSPEKIAELKAAEAEKTEAAEPTAIQPIKKETLKRLESPVKKKKKKEEDSYLLPSED